MSGDVIIKLAFLQQTKVSTRRCQAQFLSSNVRTIESAEIRAWVKQHSSNIIRPSIPRLVSHELANNVFEDPKFQRCFENRGHTLVLLGKPGVGKTTTMLQLLQQLQPKDIPPDPIPLQNDEANCVDSTKAENNHGLGSLSHYLAITLRHTLDSVFGCLTPCIRSTRLGAWLLPPREPQSESIVLQDPNANPTHQEAGPIVTASIFYKYEDKSSQQGKAESQRVHDEARILMEILEQLIDQTSQGLNLARGLRERQPRGAPRPRDVSDTIIDMLDGTSKACFFLDAIDECALDQRLGIMTELEYIQKKTRVGIVVTDRVGISDSTYPHNAAPNPNREFVELRALEVDIDQFLQSSLDERSNENREKYAWVHKQGTKRDVIAKIIAASGDM